MMGSASGIQAVQKESAATRVRDGLLGSVMNIILALFSLMCIFPLVWMLYSSFKTKREFNSSVISLPSKPTIENYLKIFANKDANLIGAMGNSMRTVRWVTVIFVHCRIYTVQGQLQAQSSAVCDVSYGNAHTCSLTACSDLYYI